MPGNKLQQLSDQLDFLIKLEQDSLDECFQEYGSLMLFLEKAAVSEGDEEVSSSIQAIRDVLMENQKELMNEYQADLEVLRNQQEIVRHALTIKDPNRLTEIEKIILDEVGELEDSSNFKKRVKASNLEMRQDFLRLISEIREVVNEGDLEELADLLAASNLDGEDEGEDDDDKEDDEEELEVSEVLEEGVGLEKNDINSHDCADEDCGCMLQFDLSTNSEIIDFLKKYGDPYFVENKSDISSLDALEKKK